MTPTLYIELRVEELEDDFEQILPEGVVKKRALDGLAFALKFARWSLKCGGEEKGN